MSTKQLEVALSGAVPIGTRHVASDQLDDVAIMNPVAVTIMLGVLVGFAATFVYAFVSGSAWILAMLAIVMVALFVRWS